MKKEKNTTKNYNMSRHVLLLLLFFFTLFSFGKNVFASTYVEMSSCTISSTGYVANCGMTGSVYGYRQYKGTYPDTSIQQVNASSNMGASVLNSATFTFQDGWGNGLATTNDGDYWLAITTAGSAYTPDWSGTIYYVKANRTGGTSGWSFVPTVIPDGITTVTSPTATTYLSNPVTFSGTYANGATFNVIQFDIRNTTQGIQLNSSPLSLPAVNGSGLSFSTTKNLPFQGNYTVSMRLYDTVNATSTAWTSPISFGLGTTTIATTTEAQNSFTPLDCGALDIGCYLKNAFAWAFYPDPQSTEQFSTLGDSLQGKFPFAYAYQVGDLREELFGASTTPQTISFTMKLIPGHASSTIEVLSQAKLSAVPYANTIKTILGWLLWFFAIEFVYYRVIRSHDSNTPNS